MGTAVRAGGLMHRVLAFYLARIARRRLHRLDACRSVSQFASVCFGLSPREARDLVAAGQALRRLPLILARARRGLRPGRGVLVEGPRAARGRVRGR